MDRLRRSETLLGVLSSALLVLGIFGAIWLVSVVLEAAFRAAFGTPGYDANGRPQICDAYDTDGNLVMTPEQLRVCQLWIANVRQPDVSQTCCGVADAFEANLFETDANGVLYAIITKNYPMDHLKGHPDGMKAGDRIMIPPWKMNDATKQGNPTGKGIVFLNIDAQVLCYLGPWGN